MSNPLVWEKNNKQTKLVGCGMNQAGLYQKVFRLEHTAKTGIGLDVGWRH
jgi:hypothetical protein